MKFAKTLITLLVFAASATAWAQTAQTGQKADVDCATISNNTDPGVAGTAKAEEKKDRTDSGSGN